MTTEDTAQTTFAERIKKHPVISIASTLAMILGFMGGVWKIDDRYAHAADLSEFRSVVQDEQKSQAIGVKLQFARMELLNNRQSLQMQLATVQDQLYSVEAKVTKTEWDARLIVRYDARLRQLESTLAMIERDLRLLEKTLIRSGSDMVDIGATVTSAEMEEEGVMFEGTPSALPPVAYESPRVIAQDEDEARALQSVSEAIKEE